jgi:hypothetical protein
MSNKTWLPTRHAPTNYAHRIKILSILQGKSANIENYFLSSIKLQEICHFMIHNSRSYFDS